MKGLWTPKQHSSIIQNLAAELNSILGGNFFAVSICETGRASYCYTLELTAWALNKKKNLAERLKYLQVFESQKFTFSQLQLYMAGIISGLKLAEILVHTS